MIASYLSQFFFTWRQRTFSDQAKQEQTRQGLINFFFIKDGPILSSNIYIKKMFKTTSIDSLCN